jgi:hypothetical protein
MFVPGLGSMKVSMMGGLIGRFLGHVLPGVVKPLHVLWNEIIGFVFIALGLSAIPSSIRNLRAFEGDAGSFFRVFLSVAFVALMAYFGVNSFLRARKISRS